MTDRWTPRFDDGESEPQPARTADITPARGRPGSGAAFDDDRPTPRTEPRDDRDTDERDTDDRHTDDRHTDWEEDDWDEDESREPNYLVRRALLVGSVVVAIIVVAIVVNSIIERTSSDGGSDVDAAEWDTIVVLTADEIRLLGRESDDDVALNYDGPDDLLDAQSVVAGPVLVTLTDSGRIDQVDLSDGSERSDRAGRDETLQISADNPSIALVGADGGGDVTIVRTVERETISIADVADVDDPRIDATDVRVNAGGTHVTAPVPSLFQSFVVDLDAERSEALAGRAIAIDDERVLTELPVGDESELRFYDLTGVSLGSVEVPAPAATLLTDDGALLLVASDGVVRSADADGTVDDRGELDPPPGRRTRVTDGAATYDGQRLVATGDDLVFVVDADGTQLSADEGRLAVPASSASRCIVVTQGNSSSGGTILDLETGDVVTEFDRGVVTSSSLDGCTVAIAAGRSPQLISEGEVIEVDADGISGVAPDGSAYLVDDGRDTELVRVGSDDTTEVSDEPVIIRFASRENR